MKILASTDENAYYERVLLIQDDSESWTEECEALIEKDFVHTTKVFSSELNAFILFFEKNNVTVDF